MMWIYSRSSILCLNSVEAQFNKLKMLIAEESNLAETVCNTEHFTIAGGPRGGLCLIVTTSRDLVRDLEESSQHNRKQKSLLNRVKNEGFSR